MKSIAQIIIVALLTTCLATSAVAGTVMAGKGGNSPPKGSSGTGK